MGRRINRLVSKLRDICRYDIIINDIINDSGIQCGMYVVGVIMDNEHVTITEAILRISGNPPFTILNDVNYDVATRAFSELSNIQLKPQVLLKAQGIKRWICFCMPRIS